MTPELTCLIILFEFDTNCCPEKVPLKLDYLFPFRLT